MAAVYFLQPREGYDALKGWNASLLKCVLTKTPKHAWCAFLDPDRPASKDSAAFRVGTLVHQALLEPPVFQSILPCEYGSTTKAFAEFVRTASADGKSVAQASEYMLAEGMAKAVQGHPAIGPLFQATDDQLKLNELTLAWEHPQLKCPCKARLDAVRITDDEILILDLKTTQDASPTEFGKSAANFHYLLQASFYADAVYFCARELERNLGLPEGHLIGKPIAFEFVAVEKEPPYQVARYRLTQEQAALGRQLYVKALETVISASSIDYWPSYDSAPQPLELPAWAYKNLEQLAQRQP